MYQHENITLLNCDCMDYMATCERFDIGLVDPPYGIGIDGQKGDVKNGVQIRKNHSFKGWDNAIPSSNYFDLLKTKTENQIIWGGNYFTEFLPPTKAWIFWYKGQQDLTMSDGEMAWTSFDKVTRMIDIHRTHLWQEKPMHPTQKPIKLYRWIIKNYVKPNQSILDTHGGSMSIAIAVHEANTVEKMNLKLVVCEKDTDYYNDAVKRFKNHISQQKINFPL